MKNKYKILFTLFLALNSFAFHAFGNDELKLTVEKASKAIREVKKLGSQCASCEAAGVVSAAPPPSQFSTQEVDPSKFVVVSAPIGSTGRAQLNIYEQLLDTNKCKPGKHCNCYRTNESTGVVTPILGRTDPEAPHLGVFDFTGKCRRYLDANGYMARIGNEDLTSYSLRVIPRDGANILVAANGTQEIEIGRTKGSSAEFLKIELNSGWRLMRRTFQGKPLGFVYLYRD
jgi:hypothetical protein